MSPPPTVLTLSSRRKLLLRFGDERLWEGCSPPPLCLPPADASDGGWAFHPPDPPPPLPPPPSTAISRTRASSVTASGKWLVRTHDTYSGSPMWTAGKGSGRRLLLPFPLAPVLVPSPPTASASVTERFTSAKHWRRYTFILRRSLVGSTKTCDADADAAFLALSGDGGDASRPGDRAGAVANERASRNNAAAAFSTAALPPSDLTRGSLRTAARRITVDTYSPLWPPSRRRLSVENKARERWHRASLCKAQKACGSQPSPWRTDTNTQFDKKVGGSSWFSARVYPLSPSSGLRKATRT